LSNSQEKELGKRILSAIQTVLGTSSKIIALHEPEFVGSEWEYVKDCLDSGWVSSAGSYVDQFEKDLCNYTGAKYAVATVNGTAALHLSLILAGVKSGDEVIVPTLSFIATANAVSYCNAIPHFTDINEKNLGLDSERLNDYLKEISEQTTDGLRNKLTGRRIAAIIAMHTFGHPVDVEGILEVCERYNLPLVEDAAESLGSKYKDRHCGTFGRVAALSFNGNKILTTGGGGAIFTNDKNIFEQAKHLSTTAKLPHSWSYIHDAVGFNYRMPNINAALGCAQLESLETRVLEKRSLAKKYRQVFKGIPEIDYFTEPNNSRSNYWLNSIILNQPPNTIRDELLQVLNDANFMSRPTWALLHQLIPYQKSPRMQEMPIAEKMAQSLINLPSSPILAR